jgi:hypothetical protein
VKSFKEVILPMLIGTAIGVILLFIATKIGEKAAEYKAAEPIVCMQDAPIAYDWNNNLIVEKMHD